MMMIMVSFDRLSWLVTMLSAVSLAAAFMTTETWSLSMASVSSLSLPSSSSSFSFLSSSSVQRRHALPLQPLLAAVAPDPDASMDDMTQKIRLYLEPKLDNYQEKVKNYMLKEVCGAMKKVTSGKRYRETSTPNKVAVLTGMVAKTAEVAAQRFRISKPMTFQDDMIDLCEPLLRYLQGNANLAKELERVENLDFCLATPLKHSFDVRKFGESIETLFDWHKKKSTMKDYMAPYFPLVQSSGMGKTKLLVEYRAAKKAIEPKTHCEILLCYNKGKPDASPYYTGYLHCPPGSEDINRNTLTNHLQTILDNALEKGSDKLVLFVDEAQHLLNDDCFLFRCFRWWLRLKRHRDRGIHVVAVFTGTTSQMANFYSEPADPLNSRGAPLANYVTSGKRYYLPFYQLHTIGLFADDFEPECPDGLATFARSVRYGRPLFALMNKYEKLAEDEVKLDLIERRLRIAGSGPLSENYLGCLSVLGSRIQMGHVPFFVASELVSKGYACLSYFGEHIVGDDVEVTAQLCYQPDPVCAYLAMKIMNTNGDKVNDYLVKGKRAWSKQVIKLYTQGLCAPSKGNVGEVAAALYMLLCGDEIRSLIDPSFRIFSVNLSDLINKMKKPHEVREPTGDCTLQALSVSFIQISRNFLRSTLKDMVTNQKWMKQLYESGCAAYLYEGCKGFDIIAPVQVKDSQAQGKMEYLPLLVQVKTQADFTNDDAVTEIERMKNATNGIISKGLCVCLVLGRKNRGNVKEEHCLQHLDVSMCATDVVYKILVVPPNDCFGISDIIDNISIVS